jgi:uncharacterized RDD family membrane protein YckC
MLSARGSHRALDRGMRAYKLDLLDRSDYAGFWQRALAWLLDTLILFLPSVGAALLMSLWFDPSTWLDYGRAIETAAVLGVTATYSIYFWTGKWHATPGKRVLGLVVLTEDGCFLSATRSTWRAVGQVISGLIVVGPLLVVTSERRQALHDLIAGTVVVKIRSADKFKIGGGGANALETI